MKTKALQSHSARQSFWILLVGMFLIVAGAISVFGIYFRYVRHPYSAERLASSVVKTVKLAQLIPPQKLHRGKFLLRQPHLFVEISRTPYTHADILMKSDEKTLRDYVAKNPDRVTLSIELANQWWLNIFARSGVNNWLLVALVFSSIALLIGMVLLCWFVIKRLALPLDAFAKTTKQFGVDVNAPPMAITGPPEMQEAIKAFNEMQSRIRRLLNDRTQMLAAISHDLRTPITRLQLRAEYLTDVDQQQKAIADLKEMEMMITSILSFARDYVRSEPTERFDMNALLNSICDEQADVGNDVTYESIDKRVPFSGRVSALKRALTNLIENAVKYGDKASVTLREKDNQLQIKIVDHGPGIPENEMEKVFSPFYRIDTSRSLQKSGTGLGLAVARDIIRAHGGEINLYNNKPEGLVVLVTLPVSSN